MPAARESAVSDTARGEGPCAACGAGRGGAELGAAWPFDGRRLCRGCADLALTLPETFVDAAVAGSVVGGRSAAGLRVRGDDLEASLVAALVGPPEEGAGSPLVVRELGGWPGPEGAERLHPAAARLLRRTALFAAAGSRAAEPDLPDGGGLDDLHRAGVLRSPTAARLAERVSVDPEVEAEVRRTLLRRRRFEVPVPPEIDPSTTLPDDRAGELSLAALAAWRLRVPALRHRVGESLARRARSVRRRHGLDAREAGRDVFVDRLGLPAAAWRDRLALLVSASNGLVPLDEARPRESGPGAGEPRFGPAPRSGQDARADADRKRRMLAYLLKRLPGRAREAGSGADRLGGRDVDVLHALYAPSLAAEHRGWTRLRPLLEVSPDGLAEKPTFTVAVPPDVVAGGLADGAAAEIAAQVEAELDGALLLVERDDGRRLPVAPGARVLAELARRNDGARTLEPRVDEALSGLEASGASHPLCGCDDCVDRILRHLRAVFLLMPFRRSVRRIVYNFLLTHYLLRCRANRVGEGRATRGVDGPDVPAVHWKTSDFARRTLAGQRRLVREGQERFRRLCAGGPVLEARTP